MPGRLCLFGEHSDWAGGYRRTDPSVEPGRCLIVGTDQGITAAARAEAGVFDLKQLDAEGHRGRPDRIPADPARLREVALEAGYDSYAAGVASLVLERFPGLGLELKVLSRTLPLKKGLSSSAAICVLTARAYNKVHGLGLSIEQEMELAYQGEILTGSSCGRMDQACAFGSIPVELTFDGDAMHIRKLAPSRPVHMLIVDLASSKDTRRILHDLNVSFAAGEPGIREALGSRNHATLSSACRLLGDGDAKGLGELMIEAQEAFDRLVAPLCPELGAPKLHAVLSHPASLELAWGGKGVGSQGDGSAQLVCRGPGERVRLAGILRKDLAVHCLDLTIREAEGPAGAAAGELPAVPAT